MVTKINRMRKIENRLYEKNGKSPSIDDISRDSKISPDAVMDLISVDESQPISMDMPVNQEGDSNIGDFIEDSKVDSPERQAGSIFLKQQLRDYMKMLDSREREIVELRFGLTDGHPKTLEEIGRLFSITRERVRQLVAGSLKKLRFEVDPDWLS